MAGITIPRENYHELFLGIKSPFSMPTSFYRQESHDSKVIPKNTLCYSKVEPHRN